MKKFKKLFVVCTAIAFTLLFAAKPFVNGPLIPPAGGTTPTIGINCDALPFDGF